ncbi:MAG TPA: hypothetical protein PKZ65_06300 [Methanoregulaceae archaeon]|nr:hypothetical protein [Methanoregulaceae archaeon]
MGRSGRVSRGTQGTSNNTLIQRGAVPSTPLTGGPLPAYDPFLCRFEKCDTGQQIGTER